MLFTGFGSNISLRCHEMFKLPLCEDKEKALVNFAHVQPVFNVTQYYRNITDTSRGRLAL